MCYIETIEAIISDIWTYLGIYVLISLEVFENPNLRLTVVLHDECLAKYKLV